MLFKYLLKTAYIGLKTNRSRSILTTLGIVIGITAIMMVASLGSGAQDLIVRQIQGMGSKTIVVMPGREPKGPSDIAQVFADSLKERDFEAITKKSNVPLADRIMPIVFGGESSSYQNQTYRLTIFGATDLIAEIFDMYPSEGYFFSDDDVRKKADVVVIGSKVKEELFGSSEALGQKIRIKGRNLRVVGVLPTKGQVSFFNFDEMAIVPYTTAQQYLFGIKYFHRFIIKAQSEEAINRTVDDLKIILRNLHNISDPSKDDFHVETQADLVARVGVITDIFTLFLIAVAAISLVVGGVGIMNIMLVAVTERTREIGLRKAIGATKEDILIQFLLEAMILTLAGGIIGVFLGTVLSYLAAFILSRLVALGWSFPFPFLATSLGLIVSAAVGLVFGIYPARQAAAKSPMEALRYE